MLTYSTTHTAYIRPLLLTKHKVFLLIILGLYVLICPPLAADAIPPEESAVYQPRDWTLPGELTPEEQAQLALDVINQAILAGAPHSSDKSNSVITSDIVSPSISQPIATLLPVAPNDQAVTRTSPEVTTVKALEKAGPAPTTVAYQAKYKELQAQWKTKVSGKSMEAGYSVFFQLDDLPSESDTPQRSSDDPYGINTSTSIETTHESAEALSSGNITSNAMQALMLKYLSDNPEIDIPLDGINVASVFVSADPENAVRINDALLKSTLLDPALDTFTKKNRSMYTAVIRLEGAGDGQYLMVMIDQHGNVSLIDPALKKKTYDSKLLSGIVTSLNTQRKATDLKFFAAETDSIVYTGLNGKDSDNTRSGLYAFAYWAAFMSTDKLDAYQNINGAASEETSALKSYATINLSSVYPKKLKQTPSVKDSTAFELDLREWLRTQVKFN